MPDVEIAGADLKRVPAPYPADRPWDLLRHKTMFQLRWTEPLPTEASTPALVERCQRIWPDSDMSFYKRLFTAIGALTPCRSGRGWRVAVADHGWAKPFRGGVGVVVSPHRF